MAYFNYHAKAKNLIKTGHCIKAILVKEYKDIGLSLVLYFDNHAQMPIRPHKFEEYFELLKAHNIKVYL